MTASKISGYGMILLFVMAIIWMLTPPWVMTPNREASPRDYAAAQSVFSRPTTFTRAEDGYLTSNNDGQDGSCPDLAMPVARALQDNRLTIAEVHDLKTMALKLHDAAEHAMVVNDARTAAGQSAVLQAPNCPRGDRLFNNQSSDD